MNFYKTMSMMFHMDYQVKGADVNDHMTMEGHAYLSYSLRHIYNFLFQLGYSRQKLNKMKIHLYERKSNIEIFKPLMFGNKFRIELRIWRLNYSTESFHMKYSYFNADNELYAVIKSEHQIKRMEKDNGTSQKVIDRIHAFSNLKGTTIYLSL